MRAVGAASAVLLILGCVVWGLGSANPETQGGYVGYLTKGAIFGKTTYVGLQTGPTSPGRAWLLGVKNVSVTPFTTSRDFGINNGPLTKDGLPVAFHLGITWKINADKVKEFVEKFSTIMGVEKTGSELEQRAFEDNVAQRLVTLALEEIHKRESMHVSGQLEDITVAVRKAGEEFCKGTPFELVAVNVNNVQLPESVRNAVAAKMKATQDLERMETELSIERKKAEIKVAEAHGIADAQNIIADTLTPAYLQYLAIQAQEKNLGSVGRTTVYIPTGPMGIPLTGTIPVADVSSAPSAEQPK